MITRPSFRYYNPYCVCFVLVYKILTICTVWKMDSDETLYGQIIWYSLFGKLYVLAKHLRIDRSNPSAAIESMKQVYWLYHYQSCLNHLWFSNLENIFFFSSAPKSSVLSLCAKATRDMVDKDLSLIIFPEGTRSKTGRLLPFKKVLTICLKFARLHLFYGYLSCSLVDSYEIRLS